MLMDEKLVWNERDDGVVYRVIVLIKIRSDNDGDNQQLIKTQFNDRFVRFAFSSLLVLQLVLYGCVSNTFKFALISLEPKSTQTVSCLGLDL